MIGNADSVCQFDFLRTLPHYLAYRLYSIPTNATRQPFSLPLGATTSILGKDLLS